MIKEPKMKIPQTTRRRVEGDFAKRMEINGVRWGTRAYLKAQYLYFTGVCIALNAMPAYWIICLMSGREIIDKPKGR